MRRLVVLASPPCGDAANRCPSTAASRPGTTDDPFWTPENEPDEEGFVLLPHRAVASVPFVSRGCACNDDR